LSAPPATSKTDATSQIKLQLVSSFPFIGLQAYLSEQLLTQDLFQDERTVNGVN
jgi:hypothetical protein